MILDVAIPEINPEGIGTEIVIAIVGVIVLLCIVGVIIILKRRGKKNEKK